MLLRQERLGQSETVLAMRILLVEDELEMAAALRAALAQHDMVVDHVTTLAEGEEAIATAAHCAILLDRQLPDGDGLTLIPRLRACKQIAPVIVLTARGELGDRVKGLDTGADDYLAKPFAIDELLARLRAVLRRAPVMAPDRIRAGCLDYDWHDRCATIDGVALDLPRRELLVLEALLRRRGRTVQRAALEEAVYGFDDEIQSNALDMHVSNLRRKLMKAGAGLEIHGIRGVGYLLKHAA